MNLLDKICSATLITASLFIFSCEDESVIGLDSEAFTTEIALEEINLTATNVFLDSLRTSGASRLLSGRSTSNVFGTSVSNALVELTTNSTALPALVQPDNGEQYYVLQDAVLNLEVVYLHAEDEVLVEDDQTLIIQQLDDNIFSGVYYLSDFEIPLKNQNPEDEFIFNLNNKYFGADVADSVSIDDALRSIRIIDSLASLTSIDAATQNQILSEIDSMSYRLKFSLSENIGNQLLEIAKNANISNDLRSSFKGIKMIPGESNSVMIGYSPLGSAIEMIYRIEERSSNGTIDTVATDTVSFLLNGNRFNQLATDRTGSVIGNYIQGDEDEFDVDNENVFLHAASGVYPKLSLRPLREFFDSIANQNEFVQINRAEIGIVGQKKIDAHQFEIKKYTTSPASFNYLFMNEQSKINTSAILSFSDLPQAGVLNDQSYLTTEISQRRFQTAIAEEGENNFSYASVATIFVQQWSDGSIDTDYIVLIPSDVNNMNQSIFNISDIKIMLYFAKTN